MGSAAESRSGPGGDHARDAGPAAGARRGSGAVAADASPARGARALSEEQFYSLYAWCLNPVLSVRELLDRLREELGRFERLASWQQQESLVNLYLFVCAIGCAVADSSAGRAVVRWRRAWDGAVDLVCDLLVAGPPAAAGRWAALRVEVEELMNAPLPVKALGETMRQPEAFRYQGLAHQDVIALARRLAGALPDREAPVLIVGVRTAGAYFAPLVRALLAAEGWARVSWIAVRPELGLSRWEARQLRRLRDGDARVALVVDDHPDTSLTVRLMLERLARYGVRLDRVTLAMPRHRAGQEWPPEGDRWAEGVRLVTLEPAELHKAPLIEPSAMEPWLREYWGGAGDVRIEESGRVKSINARLAAPSGDEGRLKRVFELRSEGTDKAAVTRHVLVKSVGWGWFGYHAYLMGVRLAGCVPRLVGLRDGLLLTEWPDEGSACRVGDARDRVVDAIALYIARRARQLALPGDPGLEPREDRRTGWDELVSILQGVYGAYVGRLKAPVLRRRLRSFVSPVPSVVDGRMRPEDWIETPGGIFKADFEQPSFGGAELDVVDPAYDLAGIMCEFALPEAAARRLLDRYARESGDRTIAERLLLYELLYGVVTMRRAASAAEAEPRPERREEWNRRRLGARRFLVSRMNRFHAGLVGGSRPRWSKRLFFLDLDGVFDCDALGFPHTTPSGLAALRLLRAHDVSVVLNTGRGVEDVRDYCRAYDLAGGLGEFGSVFVDTVAGRELALIDAEGGEQLARCRETLERQPGMCFDPGYRYSIRAYRYRNGRTVGLQPAEVGELFARARGERLDAILRPEDTYIVQRGTGKAPGVGAVRRYLGCQDEPVAAIGDSEYDVELLEMAEQSYAPANCARSVRALGRRGRCRVMRQPYQRGLLAAVRDLVGETRRHRAPSAPVESGRAAGGGGELVRFLLEAAERSTVRQWLGAVSRRGL